MSRTGAATGTLPSRPCAGRTYPGPDSGFAAHAPEKPALGLGHHDHLGIGQRDPRAKLSPSALRPGDKILLSGSIGEHGTAIMLARGEFELDAPIVSGMREQQTAGRRLV